MVSAVWLCQPIEPCTVGLLPTVDCGTGSGPSACCSSANPMHCPEFAPVQGMEPPPSGAFTAGRSGLPAALLKFPGELGTMSGTHTLVKVSSVSPLGHAASDWDGVDNTVRTGAAAMVAAMPAATAKRRMKSGEMAIAMLSLGGLETFAEYPAAVVRWRLKKIPSLTGILRSTRENIRESGVVPACVQPML